jgi:hypothetical protein
MALTKAFAKALAMAPESTVIRNDTASNDSDMTWFNVVEITWFDVVDMTRVLQMRLCYFFFVSRKDFSF